MAAGGPGSKRRKWAGYIQAANEVRQNYRQTLSRSWTERATATDNLTSSPSAVTSRVIGKEELILFPTYCTRYLSHQPQSPRSDDTEVDKPRFSAPNGSANSLANFWKQQWEDFENKKAAVTVNVRGYLCRPSSGAFTRRQKIVIGLARQLMGIQAPRPSDISDPEQTLVRDQSSASGDDEDDVKIIDQPELILQARPIPEQTRKAGASRYQPRRNEQSELGNGVAGISNPARTSLKNAPACQRSVDRPSMAQGIRDLATPVTVESGQTNLIDSLETPAGDLARINGLLMARMVPFMSEPCANRTLSVFFFNGEFSAMKTIETDAFGQFLLQAALDFVPTDVRVLASEKLSLTQSLRITEPRGISVISDIDDTVKHTGISSGAREAFRNVFTRDLEDLQVEGVQEWYTEMFEQAVEFHYVSNSPWQLYPLLRKFFTMGHLPPGSFHLKQYSGILSGIFEPAAGRKRGALDRILRDFPHRKFLLIGDSGEADLEIYTELALDYPDQILGIFIRDVTTTVKPKFFNNSYGSQHQGFHYSPGSELNPAYASQHSLKVPDTEFSHAQRSTRTGLDPSFDTHSPLPARRRQTGDVPHTQHTQHKQSCATDQLIEIEQIDLSTLQAPQRPPKPRALQGRPVTADLRTTPVTSIPSSLARGHGFTGAAGSEPTKLKVTTDASRMKNARSASLNMSCESQLFAGCSEGPSRKEQLWHNRWADAKAILERQQVALYSWRSGYDCKRQALDLIKRYG